jgi:hypothetical protein
MTIHSYIAYGLRIHSAVLLPEFAPAHVESPDVVVRVGSVNRRAPAGHSGNDYYCELTQDEAYFFWESVGSFVVRAGREVVIDARPGADEAAIRAALEGVVFGCVCHQRGLLALHASALVVDGSAVAFLGAKGQGKSTMAAALYRRGHTLLTDDVLVIDDGATRTPEVLPAFPQLKLWPNAASASLGDDAESLPRLTARSEKRTRRAADGFSHARVPLGRIYLLDQGSSPTITPVEPQEAVLAVIAQSYVARVFPEFLQGTEAASHLLRCSRLATKVPVYRLQRPADLSLLHAVAQLVEKYSANRN